MGSTVAIVPTVTLHVERHNDAADHPRNQGRTRKAGNTRRYIRDDHSQAAQHHGRQAMNTVDPTELGRKILADLSIGLGQGFRYSRLRSGAVLIESEAGASDDD